MRYKFWIQSCISVVVEGKSAEEARTALIDDLHRYRDDMIRDVTVSDGIEMLGKDRYACGHGRYPTLLDDNLLSVAAYWDWKETTGFEGDMSECWECYCKRVKG